RQEFGVFWFSPSQERHEGMKMLGKLMPLCHIRYEQWRQFWLDICQPCEVLTPGTFFLSKLRQTVTPYGLEPDLFYRALACRKGIGAFLTGTLQVYPVRLHKHIIVGFAVDCSSLSEPYKSSMR